MKLSQPHTLVSQSVELWGLEHRIAVAADVTVALVISHHIDDVGPAAGECWLFGSRASLLRLEQRFCVGRNRLHCQPTRLPQAAACPLGQLITQLSPSLLSDRLQLGDNLGMLLRSTEATGVDGVVLSGDTTDPFSRRVLRGSRGAVFSVPICIRRESAKAIEEARSSGLQVIATSANADTPYTDIEYTKPTMIIVGSEHTGISDAVREFSDAVVQIPMLGRINSLNIAVAASIVLYEAVRQRR